MAPGAFLKTLDHLQEALCGSEVPHVIEYIGLSTNQLVGFGQVGATTVPYKLTGHPGGQWVARYARESIRTAALQGELQAAQRQLLACALPLLQL